jgi:hypothetical protein
MSEIILQIQDETSLDRIIALLAPYIKGAKVNRTGKIWSGKADWLDHPVRIDGFKPLSREEAHER